MHIRASNKGIANTFQMHQLSNSPTSRLARSSPKIHLGGEEARHQRDVRKCQRWRDRRPRMLRMLVQNLLALASETIAPNPLTISVCRWTAQRHELAWMVYLGEAHIVGGYVRFHEIAMSHKKIHESSPGMVIKKLFTIRKIFLDHQKHSDNYIDKLFCEMLSWLWSWALVERGRNPHNCRRFRPSDPLEV